MTDEYDPRDLLRGSVPTIDEVKLLPDTDQMLLRRMENFDFEADLRDPLRISGLLIESMKLFGGVGLAANQIGLEARAFAMLLDNSHPIVLFNPIITDLGASTTIIEEGCLTFPDLFLKIARPESCRVIYHDPHEHRQSVLLEGFNARIAQHEIDHLNGVVMTSKVSRLKLDMAKKRSAKRR